MLYAGMLLQGVVILAMMFVPELWHYMALAALLGRGTAMVYPPFLATVAEHMYPLDRAASQGIFRFWRDPGYALGALTTGLLADFFGKQMLFLVVGLLTLYSALVIYRRMQCNSEPEPATG